MAAPHVPDGEVARVLERHERRRLAGVPTISVLLGPSAVVWNHWQRWSAQRQVRPVMVAGADARRIVQAWARQVGAHRPLVSVATAYLARRLGMTPEDLQRRLARQSSYERALTVERHLAAEDAADCAGRWLLEAGARDVSAPSWVDALDAALARRFPCPFRVIRALSGLLPRQALPAPVFAPDPAHPRDQLMATARALADLACAVPELPLAILISPEQWAAYLQDAAAARAPALLREGLVHCADLAGPKHAGEPEAELARSVRRLLQEGASAGLVQALAEAARQRPTSPDEQQDENARSAAEHFLHLLLQTLPATAGLFELNAELDFRFGPRAAEVDLACRDLGIAIEIDGYYHFQDLDAYRRDRRKDWALQRAGFLVLRFLADDVVVRLEETLDTILAAIACRRSSSHP